MYKHVWHSKTLDFLASTTCPFLGSLDPAFESSTALHIARVLAVATVASPRCCRIAIFLGSIKTAQAGTITPLSKVPDPGFALSWPVLHGSSLHGFLFSSAWGHD